MRLARRIGVCGTLLATSWVAGCAQGGGGTRLQPDAGHVVPGHDSGLAPGTDAGSPPPDAGRIVRDSGPQPVDSGPIGCTGDTDCDDGLVCNGIERCQAGTCAPGTMPICDDGIACTHDRCLEPSSGTAPMCDAVPDDSLCPSGQSCGATGCSSTCGESPCRLISPQCGCGAGQACYLSGTTRGCAAAGTTAEGASCSGVADCSPGLTCLNVARSGTSVSQCGRFCATDSDCTGAGLCIHTLSDGAGGTVSGVMLCSVDCDPISQAGCVSGSACQIYQESMGAMRFFTDCVAPVGAGGQGASCSADTDCRAGFACAGSPSVCQRWCDAPGMAAAGGCASSEACYGFSTPLVVGGTEYGVCDTYP